jgi:hypothetical protein
MVDLIDLGFRIHAQQDYVVLVEVVTILLGPLNRIHVLAPQTIALALKLHRHVRSLFRDHDRVAGTRKVVSGRAHFGELPEAYEAEGAV